MRYISTIGLILKKQTIGEHDNVLTIFSPELGKIRAYGKSTRKLTSSMIGHLETLNFCKFQLYKANQRLTIVQCQPEKSYTGIRENLDKSLFAMNILELFEKSTLEEHSDYEALKLILSTLDYIETSDNYDLLIETFKIKLLNHTGHLPEIAYCFFCSHKWTDQEKIWINTEGHLACEHCITNLEYNIEFFPFEIMKLIHYICLEKDISITNSKIKLSEEQTYHLKKITNIFINNFLHRELNSEKIVSKIRNSNFK